MKKKNPLLPKTPEAPSWDSKVTASGVYITSDFEIASDYAYTVSDTDNTDPIIISIDVSGLEKHADPQAIDLLYELYMQHRYDVMDHIKNNYNEQVNKASSIDNKKLIRRQLGTFYNYIIKSLTTNNFPTVRIEHQSLSKSNAAQLVFPHLSTWNLIKSIRSFYKEKALQIILEWLDVYVDEEESPYSTNSCFISPRNNFQFEPEFWYFISKFAYISEAISDNRIMKVYKLNNKIEIIYDSGVTSTDIAYHGTGLSRIKQALSLPLRSNPAYCETCDRLVNESLVGKECRRCTLYGGKVSIYKHIDEPDVNKMIDTFCDCKDCKRMCSVPCWPTPREAEALINAGYADKLMLNYWVSSDLLNYTEVLCPAHPHFGKHKAPFFGHGCILNNQGLCEIHGELKPLEARKAHHSSTPKGLRYAIAKIWNSEEGKNIISRWKELVYYDD